MLKACNFSFELQEFYVKHCLLFLIVKFVSHFIAKKRGTKPAYSNTISNRSASSACVQYNPRSKYSTETKTDCCSSTSQSYAMKQKSSNSIENFNLERFSFAALHNPLCWWWVWASVKRLAKANLSKPRRLWSARDNICVLNSLTNNLWLRLGPRMETPCPV